MKYLVQVNNTSIVENHYYVDGITISTYVVEAENKEEAIKKMCKKYHKEDQLPKFKEEFQVIFIEALDNLEEGVISVEGYYEDPNRNDWDDEDDDW